MISNSNSGLVLSNKQPYFSALLGGEGGGRGEGFLGSKSALQWVN